MLSVLRNHHFTAQLSGYARGRVGMEEWLGVYAPARDSPTNPGSTADFLYALAKFFNLSLSPSFFPSPPTFPHPLSSSFTSISGLL